MCGVLAGAEEPVDLVAGGIIPRDQLVELGREVHLALTEDDAVRPSQCTQIYAMHLLGAMSMTEIVLPGLRLP